MIFVNSRIIKHDSVKYTPCAAEGEHSAAVKLAHGFVALVKIEAHDR